MILDNLVQSQTSGNLKRTTSKEIEAVATLIHRWCESTIVSDSISVNNGYNAQASIAIVASKLSQTRRTALR